MGRVCAVGWRGRAVVRAACVQSGVVSVCASVNKTRPVCSAPFGRIQGSCCLSVRVAVLIQLDHFTQQGGWSHLLAAAEHGGMGCVEKERERWWAQYLACFETGMHVFLICTCVLRVCGAGVAAAFCITATKMKAKVESFTVQDCVSGACIIDFSCVKIMYTWNVFQIYFLWISCFLLILHLS